MTTPWLARESSASGQVFEFRLWALLTEQSRGGLHVFLPASDRGIDALVHRLSDGAYIPVQAKSRTVLVDGEVHLVVWADSLQDERALIVSGLITEGGLGPTMLAVPEGDFKRLADLTSSGGLPLYSMEFGMRPRSDSRWLPHLVPTERLAEKFGVSAAIPAAEEAAPPSFEWRSSVGTLGELEVARLLGEGPELNLFRPFPDLETVELAVLDLKSRKVLGIQVKTVDVERGHPVAKVSVLASSFRAFPTTYFVAVAWLRDEARFHQECLFIPSERIPELCEPADSLGHMKLKWHPGSREAGHLDPYRRTVTALRQEIQEMLDAGAEHGGRKA
ncbi:MAG: hypothetical protein ACREOM_01620 [Candidatus Dormibacteraceae bacterium]